mgnify:CR=1 FL=1
MSCRRLMVIGIDAATFDLAQPWIESGRLPNLARFAQQGASGVLASTLPPVSPAAWSTFTTGMNPGGHGVLEFCQLMADTYEPKLSNASERQGIPFWDILAEHGVRSGVVNVPFSYPPRIRNGFMVSGMLTPSVGKQLCAPSDTLPHLLQCCPDYQIDVRTVKSPGESAKARFLDQSLKIIELRKRAALGLLREFKPEFFCVVFVGIDRVCHRFWRDHEAGEASAQSEGGRFQTAIQTAYEMVDEAVGQLVAESGDGTDVLILSDHGSGPVHGHLNLRSLLAQGELLTEKPRARFRRRIEACLEQTLSAMPRTFRNRIKSSFPHLARQAGAFNLLGGVDLSRTKAYPAGRTGGVFINLRGRQPAGIVAPGSEYEDVRKRVVRAAEELRHPKTGEKVIRRAVRREEIWSGPMLEQMPDVMLDLKDETLDIVHSDTGNAAVIADVPPPKQGAWPRVGRHTRSGMFMAMGPHVRKATLKGADIVDVPPTCFGLLGLPAPGHFDGRPLTDILTDSSPICEDKSGMAEHECRREASLNPSDEEKIADRLKDLGYL